MIWWKRIGVSLGNMVDAWIISKFSISSSLRNWRNLTLFVAVRSKTYLLPSVFLSVLVIPLSTLFVVWVVSVLSLRGHRVVVLGRFIYLLYKPLNVYHFWSLSLHELVYLTFFFFLLVLKELLLYTLLKAQEFAVLVLILSFLRREQLHRHAVHIRKVVDVRFLFLHFLL